MRLLDEVQLGIKGSVRATYDALTAKASTCTECGACTDRCPFGVDVVPKMQQAVAIFE